MKNRWPGKIPICEEGKVSPYLFLIFMDKNNTSIAITCCSVSQGLSDIYNFAITVSLENDYKVQITRDKRFITNIDSCMCSHLIITDSYSMLTRLAERVQ